MKHNNKSGSPPVRTTKEDSATTPGGGIAAMKAASKIKKQKQISQKYQGSDPLGVYHKHCLLKNMDTK